MLTADRFITLVSSSKTHHARGRQFQITTNKDIINAVISPAITLRAIIIFTII